MSLTLGGVCLCGGLLRCIRPLLGPLVFTEFTDYVHLFRRMSIYHYVLLCTVVTVRDLLFIMYKNIYNLFTTFVFVYIFG